MCPFQAKVPSPVKRSYVLVLIFFLNKWGTIFINTSDSAGALKCLTYGSWWTNTDFFFPSPSNCFFTYKIWTYSVSYSNYKIPSVFWNNLQSRKKKKKRPSVILCFSQRWSHPLDFSGTVVLLFFYPEAMFLFYKCLYIWKKVDCSPFFCTQC